MAADIGTYLKINVHIDELDGIKMSDMDFACDFFVHAGRSQTIPKEDMLKRLPWFLPKRKDALKVMQKMREHGLLNRLMGLEYRADDLDAKFGEVGHWVKTIRDKEHNIESKNEAKLPCGDLVTYMCYADSDKCLLCDRDLYNDD